MSQTDLSGQTGTLKKIKNPDKDGNKIRAVVPPTHQLTQKPKPRTLPR
jgi:hypothetical protein